MVYLDNAATTKPCPAAAEAVRRALEEDFGNPSSGHAMGRAAKARLDAARQSVAAALGCKEKELYFTSGGTEGDNWAIRAAVRMGRHKGRHIVTTAIEHPAVLRICAALEQAGCTVTRVRPGRDGVVTAEDMAAALRPDTVAVSMMLVNNETGAVQPVRAVADAVRAAGCPALFHVDAVQGFLKIPFTPKELGAHFVTVSGHKVRGPKGIGAQYIAPGLKAEPLLFGGGQESGMRSGTEPMPAILGFAAACEEGKASMKADAEHMAALKASLLAMLRERLPMVQAIVPDGAPHILCLSLPGYRGEVLVRYLSDLGVCVSSGSACHRGKPSEALGAMGLPKPVRDGVIRVSFAPDSREEDIAALTEALIRASEELVSAAR